MSAQKSVVCLGYIVVERTHDARGQEKFNKVSSRRYHARDAAVQFSALMKAQNPRGDYYQLIVEEVRQALLHVRLREGHEHRATLASLVERLRAVTDDELLFFIEKTLRDLKESRRCMGCGIGFEPLHAMALLCRECWRGHVVASHVRELAQLLQERPRC
jgi:hypothetical protein